MRLESKSVLISIHPKYVEKILNGTKQVEFRRVWAVQDVTHMVIYSTSPIMKIVAIVEITKVLRSSKAGLWEIAKDLGGGLTRQELRDYFSGVALGHALLLGKVEKFYRPLGLDEVFPSLRPPQSFVYLTDSQYTFLKNKVSTGESRC